MKKIFAIVMVVTALSMVLGGCKKDDAAAADASASAAASPAAK